MLRLLFPVIASAAFSLSAAADPVDDLMTALGVPDMIDVMRDEGVAYGDDLADQMLPGGPNDGWDAVVSRIYDKEKMAEIISRGFRAGLDGTDVTSLLAFFQSDEGAAIVSLEISAREAMVDASVEEAARAAYRDLKNTDDERLGAIEHFIEVNDLIESNVVGALNANYNFYRGLVRGGALDLGEADILDDVWSQEQETRDDTREWLFAFLLTAYGPLPDGVLDDYSALSVTPEGKAMNRALFIGFNTMYDDISFALGLAVAKQLSAQEL